MKFNEKDGNEPKNSAILFQCGEGLASQHCILFAKSFQKSCGTSGQNSSLVHY
jgi:hypothetical protein